MHINSRGVAEGGAPDVICCAFLRVDVRLEPSCRRTTMCPFAFTVNVVEPTVDVPCATDWPLMLAVLPTTMMRSDPARRTTPALPLVGPPTEVGQ